MMGDMDGSANSGLGDRPCATPGPDATAGDPMEEDPMEEVF